MTLKLSTVKFLAYFSIFWLALATRPSLAECLQPGATPTVEQKTAILDELKDAVDHERLISPDFYDKDTIKKFFCAGAITSLGSRDEIHYEMSDFEALYYYSRMYPHMSIAAALVSKPKYVGWVQLPRLDDDLNAKGVIRVFGSNFSIVDVAALEIPLHAQPFPPATAEYGAKALFYHIEGVHSVTNVQARLTPSGSIQFLNVQQAAK